MATVKIKWRPSTIEGKAGMIYYRIIHNCVACQLKTDYKVFAAEWCDARGSLVTGGEARNGILAY